jgi:hypothetical protein
MMEWLIASTDLFGLTIENWMLAIGGGLLLYFVVMAAMRRRQTRARP